MEPTRYFDDELYHYKACATTEKCTVSVKHWLKMKRGYASVRTVRLGRITLIYARK